MRTFKTKAGTELPLLDLRGKDYLQVAHRLVWFREERPTWGIQTSVTIDADKNRTVARAEIRNPEGFVMATAHKIEDVKGFPDHAEKAETGAVGRALAMCGYGTQFAPDLEEGEHRIVDSPVTTRAPKAPPAKPAVSAGASSDPRAFRFTFGKYNGKGFGDIRRDELENYLSWLETSPQTSGKPMSEAGKLTIEIADKYLKMTEPSIDVRADLVEADVPF